MLPKFIGKSNTLSESFCIKVANLVWMLDKALLTKSIKPVMISVGTTVAIPWGPTIMEITERHNQRKKDALREQLNANRRAVYESIRLEKETLKVEILRKTLANMDNEAKVAPGPNPATKSPANKD